MGAAAVERLPDRSARFLSELSSQLQALLGFVPSFRLHDGSDSAAM